MNNSSWEEHFNGKMAWLYYICTSVPHYSSASTKSHASGKSKNPYFRNLMIRSDVFFDADFDAPHMT